MIILVISCRREYKNYSVPGCNRMKKRPEAGGIRRTFRPVEGTGEGLSVPTGGLRGTSLPAAALTKEGTDKRPLSAHSVLNSITRHSSLKAKVESPQFRRGTPAGRSKSFSNHRPFDPEVFSQVEHSSQVRLSFATAVFTIFSFKCTKYRNSSGFQGMKWLEEAWSVSCSSESYCTLLPHSLWV